jgi:hypothetical protein
MSGQLSVDFDAWEDHAQWWDNEGQAARQRMNVDDATLESARHAFGKIGSSTVGASYQAALQARRDLGERLGAHAESVAAHIRRDLQTYAGQERENQRMLRG